jgi:hypothetical protein
MVTEPLQKFEDHVGKEATAVEARQGVISGRILLVLVTSLVLAIAAMIIGYFAVR